MFVTIQAMVAGAVLRDVCKETVEQMAHLHRGEEGVIGVLLSRMSSAS